MALGLKEGLVECATVCVKSVVILVLTYFSYQENAWNASQWFVHFFTSVVAEKEKKNISTKWDFSNYIQGQQKTYSETEDI